jgi:hypothetical protein
VGRITAANFKETVLRLLRVWEQWSIYPQDFLDALLRAFAVSPPAAPAAGAGTGISHIPG